MRQSLFRDAALKSAGHPLEGELLISHPVSLRVLFLAFALIALTTLLYLGSARFSRQVAVTGFIEPEVPALRLYAPIDGYVDRLELHSGDPVAEGENILEIRYSHIVGDGIELRDSGRAAVQQQREALARQAELELRAIDAEIVIAKEASAQYVRQFQLLAEQENHTRQRLTMLLNREADAGKLLATNAISRIQVEQIAEQRLLVQEQLDELASRKSDLQSRSVAGRHQLVSLDARREATAAGFQRELSELEQQLTLLDGRYTHQIVSPIGGHLDLLTLREGQTVHAGQLLATIIPHGSQVQARLFIPAHSGGSVQPGQPVRLRVDAFPYQHFGFIPGTVERVSSAVGIADAGRNPTAAATPAYEAVVTIPDTATVDIAWTEMLREGMTLTASIELERRTLLDWMLAPLRAWHRESQG